MEQSGIETRISEPARNVQGATVTLGRNGLHSLSFTGRKGATLNLWREQVDRLHDAMKIVGKSCQRPQRLLHALIGAGCPALDVEDIPALQRAIEEFNEEVAFEDRRSEPRTHPRTKLLRI